MNYQTENDKSETEIADFLPVAAPLPMPEQVLERPRHEGVFTMLLSLFVARQRARSMRL